MVTLSDEIWELAVREVSRLVVKVRWEVQDVQDVEMDLDEGPVKDKEREVGGVNEDKGEGNGNGKRVSFASGTPPLPPAKRARVDSKVRVFFVCDLAESPSSSLRIFEGSTRRAGSWGYHRSTNTSVPAHRQH